MTSEKAIRLITSFALSRCDNLSDRLTIFAAVAVIGPTDIERRKAAEIHSALIEMDREQLNFIELLDSDVRAGANQEGATK